MTRVRFALIGQVSQNLIPVVASYAHNLLHFLPVFRRQGVVGPGVGPAEPLKNRPRGIAVGAGAGVARRIPGSDMHDPTPRRLAHLRVAGHQIGHGEQLRLLQSIFGDTVRL